MHKTLLPSSQKNTKKTHGICQFGLVKFIVNHGDFTIHPRFTTEFKAGINIYTALIKFSHYNKTINLCTMITLAKSMHMHKCEATGVLLIFIHLITSV